MIPAWRIVSISFSDPPKDLLCFRMLSFAATDFFVTRRVPGFWPICLPVNLAVSIPSAVLWCKSCTSFSACSNASLICSFASARRYLFTPSRIKSTLVPVVGRPPCKALLYVSVLICGSFRNTRLMIWLKSSWYRRKPSSALRDIRLTESKIIISPGFTVRKSLSSSFLPWNFVPVNTSLIMCACGCAARIFLTCLSIFCFGVLILA